MQSNSALGSLNGRAPTMLLSSSFGTPSSTRQITFVSTRSHHVAVLKAQNVVVVVAGLY